jgi:hypothetical protein
MPDQLLIEVLREVFGQRKGNPDDRVGLEGREDTEQLHRSIQSKSRYVVVGQFVGKGGGLVRMVVMKDDRALTKDSP